jgi:hypothetical protein
MTLWSTVLSIVYELSGRSHTRKEQGQLSFAYLECMKEKEEAEMKIGRSVLK